MKFIFMIIISYLLGSIPFAMIIAKAHGIELRKVGSGNIGATNLARALNKKWAYFCFVLDAAKGFIPAFFSKTFIINDHNSVTLILWLIVGIAAILGHVFPIYIGFKGGKGVATSFGAALGIWPYYTVCSVIVFMIWILVVLIWRYVSLGSIVASIVFPIILAGVIFINPDWQFAHLWPLFVASALVPIMVIVRHRENIKRIIAGTEGKIFTKKQ